MQPRKKPTPFRPPTKVKRPSPTAPEAAAEPSRQTAAKPGPGRRPDPMDEEMPKLQKALADLGLGSRREIEDWIAAGRVSVNGEPAHVGQRISLHDKVKVSGRLVQLRQSTRLPKVLIYHKPEGEIVSHDDPEGRPSVFEHLPRIKSGRWIAVGRLDYNSCGLLVLTNNGDLANRLMHPRYNLEREYAVRILGELSEEATLQLTTGIQLEDGPAKFLRLYPTGGDGANRWYEVTLSEGRNREVRRMFAAVGVTVSRLMRVRYGPIHLPPQLKRGQHRALTEVEVKSLLSILKPGGAPAMGEASAAEGEGEEITATSAPSAGRAPTRQKAAAKTGERGRKPRSSGPDSGPQLRKRAGKSAR